MKILIWLLGSKTGRITALVGLSLISAFFIISMAFRKGAASEKSKQQIESLNALRERIKSDDTISKLSSDDRRRELLKWVHDG